jgi:hypothetical protein
MSTMQAFYNQIFVERSVSNTYLSRLARLTKVSLEQLNVLKDGWVWW